MNFLLATSSASPSRTRQQDETEFQILNHSYLEGENPSPTTTSFPSSTPSTSPSSTTPRIQRPLKSIWTCNVCHQTNFSSKMKLKDHKRSEHVPLVVIRSTVAGSEGQRVLVELFRDPNTKMFECRCGSQLRSTRSVLNHRKCYETVVNYVDNDIELGVGGSPQISAAEGKEKY